MPAQINDLPNQQRRVVGVFFVGGDGSGADRCCSGPVYAWTGEAVESSPNVGKCPFFFTNVRKFKTICTYIHIHVLYGCRKFCQKLLEFLLVCLKVTVFLSTEICLFGEAKEKVILTKLLYRTDFLKRFFRKMWSTMLNAFLEWSGNKLHKYDRTIHDEQLTIHLKMSL